MDSSWHPVFMPLQFFQSLSQPFVDLTCPPWEPHLLPQKHKGSDCNQQCIIIVFINKLKTIHWQFSSTTGARDHREGTFLGGATVRPPAHLPGVRRQGSPLPPSCPSSSQHDSTRVIWPCWTDGLWLIPALVNRPTCWPALWPCWRWWTWQSSRRHPASRWTTWRGRRQYATCSNIPTLSSFSKPTPGSSSSQSAWRRKRQQAQTSQIVGFLGTAKIMHRKHPIVFRFDTVCFQWGDALHGFRVHVWGRSLLRDCEEGDSRICLQVSKATHREQTQRPYYRNAREVNCGKLCCYCTGIGEA